MLFPLEGASRGVVNAGNGRCLRARFAAMFRDGAGLRPAALRPPARSMADGAMQRIVRIHEKRGPRPTKADVERCEAMRIFARRYERIILRFAALHTLDFCRGLHSHALLPQTTLSHTSKLKCLSVSTPKNI